MLSGRVTATAIGEHEISRTLKQNATNTVALYVSTKPLRQKRPTLRDRVSFFGRIHLSTTDKLPVELVVWTQRTHEREYQVPA